MRTLLLISLLNVLIFIQPSYAADEIIPGGREFLEGVKLQEAGEYTASIEQYRAASDIYSVVADYALYRMAQCAVKLQDNTLAVSALENLIDRHPASPVRNSAQVQLGLAYFEAGEFARALPVIKAALSKVSSSGEATALKLVLAKIFLEKDDPDMSDSICWQLIHGRPATAEALEAVGMVRRVDTPEKQIAVAKVYLQNKRGSEAFALLDALVNNPDAPHLKPDALLYLAQAVSLNGQKRQAAEIYQRIIDEHPAHRFVPTALYSRAEIFRVNGSLDDALSEYERVVMGFPSHSLSSQALRQRARIFEKLADPREYAEYERILRDYPRSAAAFFAAEHWGVDLYLAKDFEKAQAVFDRLLRLNQSADANAAALFWRAKCLLGAGDSDGARSAFATVIARYGDSYQAFRARAILRLLEAGALVYEQPYSADWNSLFAVDETQIRFVDAAGETIIDAVKPLIEGLDEKAMQRLQFLVVNELPEAKLELEFASSAEQDSETQYALALVLYQLQAYNDSLRIASTLSTVFTDSPRTDRIRHFLYPVAYPHILGASASRYRIDPLFALAVMREESHFRETTVSSSDACGLMQILPRTGKWLAQDHLGLPSFERSDLFLPSVNIELGSYYLRYLLNKFGDNLMLTAAAYNWGETNLRNWMEGAPKQDFDAFVESIPADETRRYIKKVFRTYAIYRGLYSSEPLGLGAS